ncbi:MAG: HD domain-containing protein [Lachnospiraceae bacterium]|nr:HD domain-containing protein [Lachnospiraceae bacterium]
MNMETKRTNKALLIGWGIFVIILDTMYFLEYVRGVMSLKYLFSFLCITILPYLVSLIEYIRRPESKYHKYVIYIGFSLMYAYVLFTSETTMGWTYVLPMFSLLVLYHNPKHILFCGITTLILNLINIYISFNDGKVYDLWDADLRIRFFVIILCLVALFTATIIYDSIYKLNEEYTKKLQLNKETLDNKAKELTTKNDQLREMTMQTIMTIANTIDAKDEYTRGHSRRVSEYAVAIAAEMGFTGDELQNIRFIGLLHDIGKIGVPDNVLNKPGRLTDEEYQLMKDHTIIGGEILKDITMIDKLDVGAKYHHERYDGTGYPEGLKGEEIPLIARIIGVADAYDAMTSNRVYRKHLPIGRVISEFAKGNGKQFDPDACTALLRLIKENRLPDLDSESESFEVKQTTKILTRVIDKAEETVYDEIHYDELTNTLGRENGNRLIQNEIRDNGTGVIFVFDIDGLKKINEKEGFGVGDKYLIAVSEKIKNIRKDLLVSRFGADEFLAYFPEIDTEDEAKVIAQNFLNSISELAGSQPYFDKLSVSIGMTPVYTEKDRVSVLYESACNALFVSRQYGKGRFFFNRIETDDDYDISVANSADLQHLMDILNGRIESDSDSANISEFKTHIWENKKEDTPMHIVMFTLSLLNEDDCSPEIREELTHLLKNSIYLALREDDVVFKYSNLQFTVAFIGLEDDSIRQCINQIMSNFYKSNTTAGVEVHYDSATLN